MLDIDKQRGLVRRGEDASDLAAVGAHAETLELVLVGPGDHCGGTIGTLELRRHDRQHLVIGALGDALVAVVGLDPQDALAVAALIEVEPIGTGEFVVGGQPGQVVLVTGRGTEHEYLPVEGGGIAALAPADDLTGLVVRPRVGRIDRCRGVAVAQRGDVVAVAGQGRLGAVFGTLRVVGQGHVDLAGGRVHRAPLRAIHRRGTHQVGGITGVDDHPGQVIGVEFQRLGQGTAILGGSVRRQRQPLAAAIGVEASDVKGAAVHVLVTDRQAIGLGAGSDGIRRVPGRLGDKLVDVLVARVVTGVEHHRLACYQLARPAALVAEAAQRRALDRLPAGIGVDLDDIAELTRLVAVVTAGVVGDGVADQTGKFVVAFAVIARGGLPAVASATTGDAKTVIVQGTAFVLDEVGRPVLLAGEVGTPGRVAVGTVVVGAASLGAARGIPGLDVVAARHRP